MTGRKKTSKRVCLPASTGEPMLALQTLRMQAEGEVQRKPALSLQEIAAMVPEDVQKMFHELQVHRIELQMQNEELRRAQVELESSRARYFDLYDLAPVGYLTLSTEGLILESNLTAATLLGEGRSALTNQPISRFILKDDQDAYYLMRKQVDGCGPRACDLRMMKPDGAVFWVHLMFMDARDEDGKPVYRLVVSDITERRQLEEVLRESEERYRRLFDSASDALFLLDIESGMIVNANRAASEIYGYSREEFAAKRCAELMAEPSEPCSIIARIQQTPDEIVSLPLGYHRKKDGNVFPVEITARSLPLEGRQVILAAIRDITRRLQAREELRQSEQQRVRIQEEANVLLQEQADNLSSIHQALDSVGLIVAELGEADARILTFNPGAEKIFGFRQEEVTGRSVTCIYPPEFVSVIPDRVKSLSQGNALHSCDTLLMRKSGERFPVVVAVHPFSRSNGRFNKVVGVVRDVSELMRVQEQLQAINAELELRVEQRTHELQESQKQCLHAEKLSAIGRLSASIAHEFNNPLQGILSILQGLKKRAILEEEDKELLGAAISEGQRIKELIRNLQEFNRPSTGKKVAMDVHRSLDAILLLQKSDFRHKRIAVVVAYDERLPQIVAVPDQIKQVFLNLLANAADACPPSGGEITIKTRQEGDRVAVAIHDTGIGIKPEDMEQIFQPFYSTKAAVKGTGLGLSVSFGIVKQHQGEIRVESQPGAGTTFTVLLPIRGDDDHALPLEPAPSY